MRLGLPCVLLGLPLVLFAGCVAGDAGDGDELQPPLHDSTMCPFDGANGTPRGCTSPYEVSHGIAPPLAVGPCVSQTPPGDLEYGLHLQQDHLLLEVESAMAWDIIAVNTDLPTDFVVMRHEGGTSWHEVPGGMGAGRFEALAVHFEVLRNGTAAPAAELRWLPANLLVWPLVVLTHPVEYLSPLVPVDDSGPFLFGIANLRLETPDSVIEIHSTRNIRASMELTPASADDFVC